MIRNFLTLFLILIFACCSFTGAFAQKKKLSDADSLLIKLNTAKHDTVKLLALANLVIYYGEKGQTAMAQKYADEVTAINGRTKWKPGFIIEKFTTAIVLYARGDYARSLPLFQHAQDMARQGGRERLKYSAQLFLARNQYYAGQTDAGIKNAEEVIAYYKTKKENRKVVSEMGILAYLYAQKGEFDKALQCSQQALAISRSLNDVSLIAGTHLCISYVYGWRKDYAKTLEYSLKALELLKGHEDDALYLNALQMSGQAYHVLAKYDEAIDYYLRYARLAEKQGNTMFMTSAYYAIGTIYQGIKDHKQGLKYFTRALEMLEEQKSANKSYLHLLVAAIDVCYYYLGDYDSELIYDKRLLTIDIDTATRINDLNSIAWTYFKKKDYNEAYRHANEGLLLSEKANVSNPSLISTMGSIMRDAPDDVLLKNGVPLEQRNQKVLTYFLQSKEIKLKRGMISGMSEDYRELSLTYEKMHQYDNAFDTYKQYIKIRDSIDNSNQASEIKQRIARFDFSKTEDSLKYQQRLTAEQLTKQTLLSNQQKQSLLINQQKLTLANRQQELAHLQYLKTQADFEAEQSKRKANDQRLNVIKKEQALSQATVELQKVEIKSKQQQSYFFIGGLAAVIALSVFIYLNYNNQRKSNVKLAEANALVSEANKELSEQREEITAQRDQLAETVSDLKTAQKQLVQAEKMASLGELTAGIAHEIQNPLNFVNNFSDVSVELLDEMEEELDKGDIEEVKAIIADVRQNLGKINHHGKRADGIVKGMLQHSNSSGGKKAPSDINKLADEYLRLAYHGLRAKDKTFNADLVTNLDEQLPTANIIPQDIGRVMLNLFNNAFYAVNEKAKTAGANYKPKVALSTKTTGKQIEITVSDNGTGIPEHIREKIMQPFFTTKPTGQGTGLGLSLSYDIVVKGHGGELKVNSEVGEGTWFTILLPMA